MNLGKLLILIGRTLLPFFNKNENERLGTIGFLIAIILISAGTLIVNGFNPGLPASTDYGKQAVSEVAQPRDSGTAPECQETAFLASTIENGDFLGGE
jgi:hypothetical protein